MNTTSIYKFKWWQLFAFYIFIYSAISWLTNSLIYTNSYYYSALGYQLSNERINQLIELSKRYQLLTYISMPLLLLLKWFLITGVIYTALFLLNKTVLLGDCFKIVIIAELALIIAGLVKLFYFIIYKPQTIHDVQYFYPLAFTQLLNTAHLPSYIIYPLQQFNLFEVAYWILITLGIKEFINQSFLKSLKITASSYGVALIIWVLCIMFIQLQTS